MELKWLELIRVQSSLTLLNEATPSLMKEVKKIQIIVGVEDAFIMRHSLYDGDLTVAVIWNNDKDPIKSREGLMIAEQLQHLGTIDHAVWILTNDTNQGL